MKYNTYGQNTYMSGDIRPEHAVSNNIRPVGLPAGAVYQHATGGAVPQWALKRSRNNEIKYTQDDNKVNDANCYMTFDGQNLEAYKNNALVHKFDAMSGREDNQNRASQRIPNKGPIPEGTYYANQDQRQNIDLLNAGVGTFYPIAQAMGFKGGAWKGGPMAWGLRRVWLNPDANTNTYGRDGFSIHGGWRKGSAGCIDIPWQTKQFSNFMDDCQDSIPIYVKYPKESW